MSMVKPVNILVKARRSDFVSEVLEEGIISSLTSIQTEKIMRSSGGGVAGGRFTMGDSDGAVSNSSSQSASGAGGSSMGASGGFVRGERRHHNNEHRQQHSTSKKPNFKKKVESFDEAMKNKIVSEMNKISPQNYDSVLQSLVGVYSRIADEEHPWVFRLILTNATRQHVFAELYINLYKDIMGTTKEDKLTGEKILQEYLDQHKDTILSELSNGDNYDDFCEANKLKTSRVGLSIFLAEASNKDLIPISVIGVHATKLVEVVEEIRANASKISKESTENQIECVLRFFTLLSKTKIGRAGFRVCVDNINTILTREKVEKLLSPKARFAIMDFIDDMNKKIAERTAATTTATATAAATSAAATPASVSISPSTESDVATSSPPGEKSKAVYRPKHMV